MKKSKPPMVLTFLKYNNGGGCKIMVNRDYYEVLGTSKTATDAEIKSAYRKLAKQYHPDVSKEENAGEKFKEVQEAYDVLSDNEKRSAYDQFGHATTDGFGGQGGYSGFGGGFDDFGDLFGSMFGGGFGGFGGRQANPNAPQRGGDLSQAITITFEEAAFGATKNITVNREEECKKCGGSGARSKDDIKTCSRCNGIGQVIEVQNTILGRVQTQNTCRLCQGLGKKIIHRCDVCKSHGTVNKTKTIEVKLPAGIGDGEQIRLTGQGEAGRNQGPSGDLYVTFRVLPHEFFQRDGYDLHCEVPITFSQATLGDEIEVPTLDGKVALKIPAGMQPEADFRIRSKGIKYINRKTKGDLYIKAKLVVPKKINQRQQDLLKELDSLEDKSDSIWQKLKQAFK